MISAHPRILGTQLRTLFHRTYFRFWYFTFTAFKVEQMALTGFLRENCQQFSWRHWQVLYCRTVSNSWPWQVLYGKTVSSSPKGNEFIRQVKNIQNSDRNVDRYINVPYTVRTGHVVCIRAIYCTSPYFHYINYQNTYTNVQTDSLI